MNYVFRITQAISIVVTVSLLSFPNVAFSQGVEKEAEGNTVDGKDAFPLDAAVLGNPKAVKWYVQEIENMSAARPKRMDKILAHIEKIGAHTEILRALVHYLSRYEAFFSYATPERGNTADNKKNVRVALDDFTAPLQRKISKTLREVVDEEDAPDLHNMRRDTDHEWASEMWRSWWKEKRQQDLQEMKWKSVVKLAKAGKTEATYHLGTRRLENANDILQSWLEADDVDRHRAVILHAALAKIGNDDSIAWIVRELQNVKMSEYRYERNLFNAVREIGKHPDIVRVLTSMLTGPKVDDYRSQGMFQGAPPRNYMAARTLAAIVEGSRKLREIRLSDRHAAVEEWIRWAQGRKRKDEKEEVSNPIRRGD